VAASADVVIDRDHRFAKRETSALDVITTSDYAARIAAGQRTRCGITKRIRSARICPIRAMHVAVLICDYDS
jgi:hypothetical protein